MITIDNRDRLVNAAVFGEFTLSDFRQFEDATLFTLQQFPDGADLLLDLRDMTGFTMDVVWREIRFTRQHARDFRRIAVVGSDPWLIWSAWLTRAFVEAELRVFEHATQAEAWVRDNEGIRNRLVSTEELAAHLGDSTWVVCDCRHDLMDVTVGERAFAEGHIPGARFLHLDRDLSGPKTGKNGRHPLPDPKAVAELMGRLGIGDNTQVVAYDASGGSYAARLWWTLRWLGHEAVAVLDGGWGKWVKEGRPQTQAAVMPEPTRFTARPNGAMRVDAAQILHHLGQPDMLVVDARAAQRYRGETEPIDPVAGHIPGARNRPNSANLDEHGCFKSPRQLREEFRAVIGAIPPSHVVNQCGSGVTAAHNLLAMEIAGLSGARLYPGSWSEWCADPARPVAKGDEPAK